MTLAEHLTLSQKCAPCEDEGRWILPTIQTLIKEHRGVRIPIFHVRSNFNNDHGNIPCLSCFKKTQKTRRLALIRASMIVNNSNGPFIKPIVEMATAFTKTAKCVRCQGEQDKWVIFVSIPGLITFTALKNWFCSF